MAKTCKECGATFEPSGRNQKYCSKRCARKVDRRSRAEELREYKRRWHAANRDRVRVKGRINNKRYAMRHPDRIKAKNDRNNAKYSAARRPAIRACKWCGCDFQPTRSNQKFCNNRCGTLSRCDAWRMNHPDRWKQIVLRTGEMKNLLRSAELLEAINQGVSNG